MHTLWVAAKSKGNQVNYAAGNCRDQGYDAYTPLQFNRSTQRREHMFPGYLFVETPRHRWRPLLSTRGIAYLILTDGVRPARVARAFIEELRNSEDARCVNLPEFELDEEVRVTDGPLLGQIGLYQGKAPHERVKVLLSMFGSWRPFELREEWVEAAA